MARKRDRSARYRDIADRLRADILAGRLRGRIPTEPELQQRFGASRTTVRLATGLLKDEGLLRAERGHGTAIVYSPPTRLPVTRYAAARDRMAGGPFERAAAAQGLQGYGEVVAVEQEEATTELAARLEVEPGALVVHRRRHMLIDGELVQRQDGWFPFDLVGGTRIAGREKLVEGTYGALDSIGHGPARITEELSARMPTADELALLDLGPGVPVVVVERVTRDSDGLPVEFLRVVAAADRHVFVYDDLPVGRG